MSVKRVFHIICTQILLEIYKIQFDYARIIIHFFVLLKILYKYYFMYTIHIYIGIFLIKGIVEFFSN